MVFKYYYEKIKAKKYLIALFFIFSLGLFLRLYHLGSPSLWLDELIAASRVDTNFSRTLSILSDKPHPTLYFILMNLWVRLFGTGEFFLRLPSALLSALSITLMYQFSKELFDKGTGLIAALLLSISTYSINYAQDAMSYSMFWLLGLLSFYFFYKSARDNNTVDLLLYIVCSILATYTSYFAFLFIVIQNIIFFSSPGDKRVKKWLIGQAFIILLCIPLIFNLIKLYLAGNIPDWIPKERYLKFLCILFLKVLSIAMRITNYPLHIIEACLYLFLSSVGLLSLTEKKDAACHQSCAQRHSRIKIISRCLSLQLTQQGSLILCWIAVPLILFYLYNRYVGNILVFRYLGFIHFPLILLLSRGLSKCRKGAKITIIVCLLVVTIAYKLYPYYTYQLKEPRQDYRGLSILLRTQTTTNDLIIAFPGLRYYIKDREIISLSNEETQKKDKRMQYDSIFVVFPLFPPKQFLELLPKHGYRLVERYREKGVGFLKYEKAK